jgi:hypothetical protein
MFGLNKKTKSAREAEADFDLAIRDAMTRGRMAKVNESTMAGILTKYADGIRRAALQYRELRNNRAEGNSQVVSK